MNNKWKTVLYILLGLAIVAGLVMVIVPISYQNKIAQQELFVTKQKDNCSIVVQNGTSSIIELAQVDENTKTFLVDYIKSASPEQTQQITDNYAQFVQGNTQPFLLMLSSLAGTNLTITAENLQREIVSQRAQMTVCASQLVTAKYQLMLTLGRDASGNVVMFPQRFIPTLRRYPSTVVDGYLNDTDGDGRLTVLDYQPPVSLEVLQSFGGQAELDSPLNIYGN